MITLAPTTKRNLRFGIGTDRAEKQAHIARLRDGLKTIDENTERVEVSSLLNAPLTLQGKIGDYQFTKEGFSSLCSRLSPNTFAFLKGIDNADMGTENKTFLQTKIFNDIWTARSHELDGAKFLVDTRTNKVEAVHSSSYGHISNVDALDMTIENLSSEESLEWYKVYGRSLDVGISDASKHITIPTARMPDGETITAVKYLQNSEDGRSRFLMGMGLYTFICTNGMRIGKEYNIVDAIHRSNIMDNIREQLSKSRDMNMTSIFSNIHKASVTRLTEELRQKSYTYLKDRVGSRQAKEFTSDSVAFKEGEVPTVYEVHSAITQEAHFNRVDISKQAELETLGFNYLNKMVA